VKVFRMGGFSYRFGLKSDSKRGASTLIVNGFLTGTQNNESTSSSHIMAGIEGMVGVQEVEHATVPTADVVRVRVHAAGLKVAPIFCNGRGQLSRASGVSTNIPGLEFAGEVESIGQEVRAWRKSVCCCDRVFGKNRGGAPASLSAFGS